MPDLSRTRLVSATVLVLAVAAPARAGTPSCASAPLTGCRTSTVPGQTRLWLNDRSGNRRDTIVWKWRRGSASTPGDFGDPIHTNGYAMCIYGSSGALVFHGSVPSGGTCGARSCWRNSGEGFHYRNGAATPDGLTKVQLRPGDDGRSGIIVKGRGVNLGLPALPLTSPITVQLQEEGGGCWAATYQPQGVRVNDGARFRAAATQ